MADDVTIDPSSVHDVQVARLDADMFNADDIDGATEGLVGSGNLNYLVLQSSQTNEASQNANPFEVSSNGDGQNGLIPDLLKSDLSPISDSRAINPSDFSHNGDSSAGFLSTATNNSNSQFSESSDTNNNNSNSALNTISATHSSISSSSSASETSNNFFPGDDGTNGNDGNNGNNGNGNNGANGNNGTGLNGTNGNNGTGLNGTNGNNGTGTNGTNGIDGHSPEIPPVTPIDSHIGVHVISDILNANLDLLVNPVGNLVGGINVDVAAILGDIL
ncbi:MAG: Hemolysin-type calcium-binding region [Micavibrio sp.]|nr:Hemolysin-type calcium-binding region [Micavibrio sp.]